MPSCSECNKSKSTDSTSTFEGQVIHPYYDDFTDEVRISAEAVEEEPVTFKLFVSYPEEWTTVKFERAKNHFKDFELNSIYKSHASEE